MNNTDLNDYDLDVINALKEFPEDDNNCYLHLRGQVSYNENNHASTVAVFSANMGMVKSLSATICGFLQQEKGPAKHAIIRGVLAHLMTDSKDAEIYSEVFDRIKKNID